MLPLILIVLNSHLENTQVSKEIKKKNFVMYVKMKTSLKIKSFISNTEIVRPH